MELLQKNTGREEEHIPGALEMANELEVLFVFCFEIQWNEIPMQMGN